MKHINRPGPPTVGGPSLLTAFAVLCLTVFALLCLTEAQAETRLGEVSRQATVAYYQADARAEAIFARLKNGERPAQVTEENGIFTYICAISDHQTLHVALSCRDGQWQVLRWQAVAQAPQGEAQTPNLWDGAPTS